MQPHPYPFLPDICIWKYKRFCSYNIRHWMSSSDINNTEVSTDCISFLTLRNCKILRFISMNIHKIPGWYLQNYQEDTGDFRAACCLLVITSRNSTAHKWKSLLVMLTPRFHARSISLQKSGSHLTKDSEHPTKWGCFQWFYK